MLAMNPAINLNDTIHSGASDQLRMQPMKACRVLIGLRERGQTSVRVQRAEERQGHWHSRAALLPAAATAAEARAATGWRGRVVVAAYAIGDDDRRMTGQVGR